MPDQPRNDLNREHQPARIRRRLKQERQGGHVGDAMLGAIDGGITSFAITAGAVGGGFGSLVVLVLGFASLLADGFSMAVSNYLGKKSDNEAADQAHREEQRHIDEVPDGQREELRQIFAAKGFEGRVLGDIVDTISANRQLWAETVVLEEFGMQKRDSGTPYRAGAMTFTAFVVAGLVPLMPFLWPGASVSMAFPVSVGLTAILFACVGAIKGWALEQPIVRAGAETLLTGGSAAALAYGVGWLMRRWLDNPSAI